MYCVINTFVFTVILSSINADYWTDRDAFIKAEESEMIGGSIKLSDKEEKVNKILMNYKLREFDAGFKDPSTFAPSKHFFQARPQIDRSDVYKLIQKIPKGAALHGHDLSLVSGEYLYSLTFRENLYACTVNGRLRMKFLDNSRQDRTCNWTLINVLRIIDPSYDSWVRSQINLFTDNPRVRYPSINDVWGIFQEIFFTVVDLITYRPIFEEYFYQALKDLYDDNVMYMEFRGFLPPLYELNGTVYEPHETVRFYEDVAARFMRDFPRFKGARLIYSPLKEDNVTLHNCVDIVKKVKANHPKMLAGFDLVGQEDLRMPIVAYLQDLKEIADMRLDFFFHAGETNWYDTSSDFNLVDAVMLGTKRIGHAYALTKHPHLMKIVKERNIAIEVCPISNQVLMLVEDMRNHPAASLIANGYPVVISYDDPTLWNGKALSYDFYMTFMGIAGRSADLKLIKQLAKNSLLYSSLPADEKDSVISDWEKDWANFLDQVIGTHANEVPR